MSHRHRRIVNRPTIRPIARAVRVIGLNPGESPMVEVDYDAYRVTVNGTPVDSAREDTERLLADLLKSDGLR